MTEDSRPPLPWETKAAIVALCLLELQWIHELWLQYADLCSPSDGDVRSFIPVGLAMNAAAGIGLYFRSKTAWWCAVTLAGVLGLLFLLKTWEPMTMLLPWVFGTPKGFSAGIPRIGFWTRLLWMAARVGLYLAVPLFLILGRLRVKLRTA